MQPLRKQLSRHFYRIMLLSILATILTWVIGFLLFNMIYQNKALNPANYYESQIPELVEFVNAQEGVMNPDFQTVLEERIPLEGIDYQIVNADGVMQYGSMEDQYITSREDVLTELNNNIYDGDKIIIYYPIIENGQHFQGVIGFRYELSFLMVNAESQPTLLSLFIFSYLFRLFIFTYLRI